MEDEDIAEKYFVNPGTPVQYNADINNINPP